MYLGSLHAVLQNFSMSQIPKPYKPYPKKGSLTNEIQVRFAHVPKHGLKKLQSSFKNQRALFLGVPFKGEK